MIDFTMIEDLLLIATLTGSITTLFVQKIKCSLLMNNSCIVILISFILSMVIGTIFSLSFCNLNLKYALWVGFFTFIGAEAIYRVLREKFNIKSLSDIKLENLEGLNETTGQESDG